MRKVTIFIAGLSLLLVLAAGLTGCGKKAETLEQMRVDGKKALDAGEFNRAVNIYKQALKEKPSDRDLLYYLGLSFKRLDMIDSALVYLRRAKLLNPRDREINKELIELCPAVGDFEGAIKAIAVMISTGDNEQMYWPALAELYFLVDDSYMAAKYNALLIAADSDLAPAYMKLATSYSKMGRYGQSNEVMFRALDRFGPLAETCGNIGINYVGLQQFEEAEVYFRLSLEIDPEHAPTALNLAHALGEQDDRAKKEEALRIYRQYASQAPPAYNVDSIISVLEGQL